MPFVKAGPNQYLLAGRNGRLVNRGSAIQAYLWPGTIWVLLPSAKQEATFEFTQETKDGIPLRFKGIVIYRVTDPVVAASLFDFTGGDGIAQISTLLAHVSLGELRHAVSHMTMSECIEQRKTTLTTVVTEALTTTINAGAREAWGIALEVAQIAQVFIVDAELRGQLEAEVRDEIRLRSEQSQIKTSQEAKLAQMASERQIADQRLESDREALRREQDLAMTRIANERTMAAEQLATERAALTLEQERIEAEKPVRLQRIAAEAEIAREDLARQELVNAVAALQVEATLQRPRAEQALRREILPLEQAPQLVESAAKVLHGTNLTLYGEGAEVLGRLDPLFEIVRRAVTSMPGGPSTEAASRTEEPLAAR